MPALRPTVLTQRGAEVLIKIERLMEDASRALAPPVAAVSELPAGKTDAALRTDAFASAAGNATPAAVRGN